MPPFAGEASRTAWISRGFEHLIERVQNSPNDIHFDVLIIGSGYGGAVAAATFAGKTSAGQPVSVGVLERGKEYLPGAFPTGLGEFPGHVRHKGNREGLFDVRPGGDVTTVVANGVGGGSIINAGVMETPLSAVFEVGWPADLSDLNTWTQYFARASEMLGATVDGTPNVIDQHVDGVPQKFTALGNMAPGNTFRSAAITVAMNDRPNAHGVQLKKCVRCGDCATGCNFGAKDSLDVNLLAKAHRNGAKIYRGATVLHIAEEGENWTADTVHTNAKLRQRHSDAIGKPEVVRIRARKIIVCAGTLGSTEIMLRSSTKGLAVSDSMLGRRCSTNGDTLIADYATRTAVNNVADQRIKPSDRAIGPTITGIIDLRDSAGLLIEEISVPASLRVAFKEIFASVTALHNLGEIDWSTHTAGFPQDDIYALSDSRVTNSALFAVMGDDGATGRIVLGDTDPTVEEDGTAKMLWPDVKDHPIFVAGVDVVTDLAKGTGGSIVPNPVWQLLPADMSWLLQDRKGPVTTVHPLGGLVMADTGAAGVVNDLGQVFKPGLDKHVHDSLVVLDGSVVPTALGTNPALTIAAVALRATEALAAKWEFADTPANATSAAVQSRPEFRSTDKAITPAPTEVEVIERLVGPVEMTPVGGNSATYIVELTLRFVPKSLADLSPAQGGDGTLQVSQDQSAAHIRSKIRIFAQDDVWTALNQSWDPPKLREQKLDAIARYSAPLTGTLKVLERQHSTGISRILRAGAAWLLNRGLRDAYQAVVDSGTTGPGVLNRIKSGLAIASRGGELRDFVYDLDIGTPDANAAFNLNGNRITGTKRFTYSRAGNPWRQLMEVGLDRFPGLRPSSKPVLTLDLAYLARISVPLFRITRQGDAVSAISDMLGFFGYFLRLLLGIHIWSFRAPDQDQNPANDAVVFKPPAKLAVSSTPSGFVDAEIAQKAFDNEDPKLVDGHPPVDAVVKITKYRHANTTQRPLVMLHGYSSGVTTFAHHAVNPNFASYFFDTGRDVWLADLRTSPRFADTTATKPWSIEQVANTDVDWVIDQAAKASVDGQVDVIAHCMGTVMFSMAALNGKFDDPLTNKSKINRVAFSQVGPLVVFTPINIFRAYAVRYLIDFLPDSYQFNPPTPTLADDLLDRFLATLPYPADEFAIENPITPWARTPWTRTRHRMDAIYGRNFSAANMEPDVLTYLDEHFGALSLRTVSSALHFARYSMMTDAQGRNTLVSRARFQKYWRFPTLSVHGADNGMSDVSTVHRMKTILDDAGVTCEPPFVNDEAGHQDGLIGTKRFDTIQKIEEFLDKTFPENIKEPNSEMVAYPPWIGPIITVETSGNVRKLVARIGASPTHRAPEAVAMIRVQVSGSQILRPDTQTSDWKEDYVLNHMAVYQSTELAQSQWDSFDVPKPSAMPGYDPAKPGNATLMLLVYDESGELEAQRSDAFFFFARGGQVFSFDPSGVEIETFEERFLFAVFRRISAATQRLINLTAPTDPAETEGGGPGLILLRSTETDREVPDGTINFSPERRNPTTLLFGQDPLQGNAVLDSIVDNDRNLMDGIVPDQDLNATLDATRFTLASCQYPHGFLDNPVAAQSYAKIAATLHGPPDAAPRFMIFAGDQVYVDPTAGLYDPSRRDDRYRIPYENWLLDHHARTTLRSVPSFMLLDDHEIDDNWERIATPDTEANQDTLKAGLVAFNKYQRGSDSNLAAHQKLETFEFDGFPFFLLDTRTSRDHRKTGAGPVSLFNDATFDRLKSWLLDTDGNRPKFIVTPSMILPRHRHALAGMSELNKNNPGAIHSDGWDGYPETLVSVLHFIAAQDIAHLVFLSGDEHRAAIATAQVRDIQGNTVARFHSVHTAAMWSPYPFANAVDADFVDNEMFEFSKNNESFFCEVNTVRPDPGDGATFLSVRKEGQVWKLDCRFSDNAVRTLIL